MNKLIKTKAEHSAAMERLSALMDADPALGSPESDELELLAHLIESYEAKAHPISLPDPIDAIRFRMEQANPWYSTTYVILAAYSFFCIVYILLFIWLDTDCQLYLMWYRLSSLFGRKKNRQGFHTLPT